MFVFEKNVGAVVAADAKDTVDALDNAIRSELQLCLTIVDSAASSRLPIASTQKLLQSMSSGLSNIVAGRADMTQAIRHLTSLKNQSSLAPMSYGCPTGMPRDIAVASAAHRKPIDADA